MFWILKVILFGELVAGGVFALILLLDWLLSRKGTQMENEKKDR